MSILSELQTSVVREIGSINATDDATEINKYLNRGVRYVLRQTKCYVDDSTVTPGANEDYNTTTSYIDILEAYFTAGGVQYPLERVTVHELLRMRRSGVSAGAPARYYALAGNNKMMFWPTPGASDSLYLLAVPAPTAMSGASDDPATATYGGIPVDYHQLIVWFACWHLARFDDDASSEYGQRYKDMLDEGIRQARRELNARVGHRQPRYHAGRRRILPADPSTDLGA